MVYCGHSRDKQTPKHNPLQEADYQARLLYTFWSRIFRRPLRQRRPRLLKSQVSSDVFTGGFFFPAVHG